MDFGGPLPAGWEFLTTDESTSAWTLFEKRFGELRPGLRPADWPAVIEPEPSVTFDLTVPRESAAAWAAQFDAVNAEALRCFVSQFDDPGWIVLDWQHPGYRFDAVTHATTFDTEWRVPIHPNGDYNTFARPDFSEGTFGHPWEQTLCVFGPRLVATLGRTLATWLPTKRVNGIEQVDSEHWGQR
nr:DUF2716 domain-containing protein [Gordonia soli]